MRALCKKQTADTLATVDALLLFILPTHHLDARLNIEVSLEILFAACLVGD